MKWLQDLMSAFDGNRRAIEERDKYETVNEMAVRGFRSLVAKRLRTAHGVKLSTIIRDDRDPEVLIDFDDIDILQVLQDVNDGIYESIDEAVKESAEHLWQTWDARFNQRPDLMSRYEHLRGHPSDD
jgi:hypothetical protein